MAVSSIHFRGRGNILENISWELFFGSWTMYQKVQNLIDFGGGGGGSKNKMLKSYTKNQNIKIQTH